uniref:Uncharacterized protein n=1 Tax=Anguilla anguilla TaxID=7936 RepID=A0A0E9TNP6_ANGAN
MHYSDNKHSVLAMGSYGIRQSQITFSQVAKNNIVLVSSLKDRHM